MKKFYISEHFNYVEVRSKINIVLYYFTQLNNQKKKKKIVKTINNLQKNTTYLLKINDKKFLV